MRLPRGIIFVSVVLSICILVLGAGAGAENMPPSDGNAPVWQFGAQQGGAAEPDGHRSPGLPGRGNMTFADNRTPMNVDNATLPFNGTFPGPGNRTWRDNQTPVNVENSTRPFNGTHPMHGNMTFADNRTPMDVGNATLPVTGHNGSNTGQQSPIDELIAALTRFFSGSS